MDFTAKIDLSQFNAAMKELAESQIPFATSVALNKTVNATKAAVSKKMGEVFDRPTRATLNSLFVTPSNKRNLVAKLGIRDVNYKGKPPTSWLAHHIAGGPRLHKTSEELLQRAGILPSGWYAVTGAGARLNQYGNMSPGQVQQILTAVMAQRDPYQNKSRTGRRNKATQAIFAVRPGTGGALRPGIYQRVGFRVQPLMVFVQTVNYPKRLPFVEIAQQTLDTRMATEFQAALEQAMASAIKRQK